MRRAAPLSAAAAATIVSRAIARAQAIRAMSAMKR